MNPFCQTAIKWKPNNNVASGNGLVPSGSKLLTKPMLAHIFHVTSLSYNGLTKLFFLTYLSYFIIV